MRFILFIDSFSAFSNSGILVLIGSCEICVDKYAPIVYGKTKYPSAKPCMNLKKQRMNQ
jgi:hypothetical protein